MHNSQYKIVTYINCIFGKLIALDACKSLTRLCFYFVVICRSRESHIFVYKLIDSSVIGNIKT